MNCTEQRPIRVLVVEDSRVVAEFLTHLLCSDSNVKVVGIAADGAEAVELVQHAKPDVITMDIHMPRLNGFEATRRIMETCPTPIVIVSGSSSGDQVANNFHAIEAGALAVVARPHGIGHSNHDESAKELVDTVKLMAEVKVVKRWPRPRSASKNATLAAVPRGPGTVRIVAVGASTGGPLVLQTILSGLPKDFSAPVLIVQHMASGFVNGFVEWLSKSSGFPVRIAKDGEPALSGHAYVAPDDFHLGVSIGNYVRLTKDEKENGMRPAVSCLFRAVQQVCGSNAIAVILTGMGADGVNELKLLKDLGAITIAQDEESSIVHGMPGQAIKAGAATHVLSPESIAKLLRTTVTTP